MTLAGLKVAFVTGTLGQGGAERQLFYMLRVLREQGASPEVFSLARGEFWQERITALGVPVHWVGQRRHAGRALDVVTAVRRFRPAVVQSSHFYTNPYGALAARACRIRAIGAVRSDGLADAASVARWLAGPCLRWPDVLCANSRAAIENLSRLGIPGRRLRLLPNAIDTDTFLFQPPARSPMFRIVAVARLTAQKRLDRLIRAMSVVRRQSPRPVRLTVAGDGPLRGELEQFVASLGLHDVVTFLGAVADVRPLLVDADCLALSSDAEGTPNAVLEAMSVGRTAVVTDVGGVRDVVLDGVTGFIVPRENEHELADRLIRLSSDASLCERLGHEAADAMVRRHSLPVLATTLEQLYGDVVRTAPARS